MANRNAGQRDPANRQGSVRSLLEEKQRLHLAKEMVTRLPYKQSIPRQYRKLQGPQKGVIEYMLDTNTIMEDYGVLFKFDEHNLHIGSQAIKELDKNKKGYSNEAWNARRAARIINELLTGKTPDEIKAGVPLVPPKEIANGRVHTGKLFVDFLKPVLPESLDLDLDLGESDDRIILRCLMLKEQGKRVVLISNDITCRTKAILSGIEAEECLADAAIPTAGEEDLRKGFHEMPEDFWATQGADLKPLREGSVTRYILSGPFFKNVYPNEFLLVPDGLKLMVVKTKPKQQQVVAETFPNYFNRNQIGVVPRNVEQGLLLQLLMDERIPAVTIAGMAGSGKTYLALLVAFHLVFTLKRYRRIIITRPAVGADEDQGFLPGTESQKMEPWMGAMQDNFEQIIGFDEDSDEQEKLVDDRRRGRVKGHEWDPKGDPETRKQSTADFIEKYVQYKSMRFMKGRSVKRTLFIVDESQDCTVPQVKMLGTRVGEGSKILFLGNSAQIDNSKVSEFTCGLSVLIRAFAHSELFGHITLQQGERSLLATEIEKVL